MEHTTRAVAAHLPVSHLTVGPQQAGQRIDNFLIRHLKGVPRTHVYRILRDGQVRVNRGRIGPAYRLQAGDALRLPPLRQAGPGAAVIIPTDLAERLRAAVLYEDADLLVIDKPAGLAVHGGSGLSYGLIEALRSLRPDESLELAHRLDRDTSGCVAIARNRPGLTALHGLWRSGAVDKRYLALLAGAWQGGPRPVDLPLRSHVPQGGERMVRPDADGQQAQSVFSPLTVYADATLVEVRITTGRMHQIRVHAAALGHPVAGDHRYGDATANRILAAQGLRRLFLHAHALRFTLPDGKEIAVSTPLPAELRAVLHRLAEPEQHE